MLLITSVFDKSNCLLLERSIRSRHSHNTHNERYIASSGELYLVFSRGKYRNVNISEHTQICGLFHWQELQADSPRPICM